MQIFTCVLLFTFVILLNFVQSSAKPSDPNERWEYRFNPRDRHRELIIINQINGVERRASPADIASLRNRPGGQAQLRRLRSRERSHRRPCQEQWTRPDQEPVEFTDFADCNGDFIYRGPNPVAKVVNEAIYDHPVKNDQPKIAIIEQGDKLYHSGAVIAEYDGIEWYKFNQLNRRNLID
ncbi:uncharacterized protein LOC117173480 [Belonocnema kinseyi]|uniref:uncharacterized protein LOC117173480 n=1 Tax=Belonocnema kinseyi TaxID=2817044 RepID=UPI00143D15F9|nr:uncharacterized protein LOC117173480 [Belonocnema kinseyi]